MKPQSLGEFENLLLLSLMQNQGKTYGMVMRQTLTEMIQRDVSIGAVYATLERMENKGYIRSSVGEPTAQRGGKAKRYFEITAKGKAAVKKTRAQLETMWSGLNIKAQL